MNDADHSDSTENGDADTTEGQQGHEDPEQELYEGHAMSRMQYDERW
ncbi:hypothetical protein [Natrialba asiatica]|nr:hypothetical protein [Natrialba asiatica]